MRLWRLSSLASADRTFDGEGARLYPGRWNDEGVPLVYTSEHLSLAVVELFVHLEPRHLKRQYYAFSVEVDDGLLEALGASRLPPDWKTEETPASTRALGSAWARAGRALGLIVPSVVVPSERNVLLNPRHPAFAELEIDGPSRFAFDRRMRKGTRPT